MTQPAVRPPQQRYVGVAASPVGVAALLAGATAAIHLKAAIDHGPHWWLYGAFFAVLAALQGVWALELARGRGGRSLLVVAVAGSALAVAVWLASRTVGVPFGPWAWQAEPVGVADLVATVDELWTAALLGAALQPASTIAARLSWVQGPQATRLVSMLLSVSLLALAFGGHSHG